MIVRVRLTEKSYQMITFLVSFFFFPLRRKTADGRLGGDSKQASMEVFLLLQKHRENTIPRESLIQTAARHPGTF
jgi:hypothetical protein